MRKNAISFATGQQPNQATRDRYGRIIGKLIKDGQDINLLQTKHGYARHYKYYQKDQSELDRILYGSAEIEAGLIDCIVSLPAKLFLNTQIPAFHQFDI